MNTGTIAQAVGLLACAGAVALIALMAGAALASARRRGSSANPVVQPPNAPPFEDDFGGVPATGPGQPNERETPPENLIGSSGFEAQPHEVVEDGQRDQRA